MIILVGGMTFDPADLVAFEVAVARLVPTVRAEDGCHHYSLLTEDRAAGRVQVTEIWRDEAALRVHLAQKWVVDFLSVFGPKARAIAVTQYAVSGSRALTF